MGPTPMICERIDFVVIILLGFLFLGGRVFLLLDYSQSVLCGCCRRGGGGSFWLSVFAGLLSGFVGEVKGVLDVRESAPICL